jgi:hypothetical protein
MAKLGVTKERIDEEHVTDNIIPFEVIPGGKEPPSDFWLKNLKVGTIFLAKHKPNTGQPRTFVIGEFIIFNISPEKGMYLLSEPKQPPTPFWVEPIMFSNQMELIEVMRTDAFAIHQGDEHDDSSGAVRSGGLQDDAPPAAEH